MGEYLTGNCLDYKFYYPYTTGPTAFALTQNEAVARPVDIFPANEQPLSPIDFLLTVSPFDSCKDFLPKEFADFALVNETYLKSLQQAPWRRKCHNIISKLSSSIDDYVEKKSLQFPHIRKCNTLGPS